MSMVDELQFMAKRESVRPRADLTKIVVMERRIVLIRWLGIISASMTVPFLGFSHSMFIMMISLILFATIHNLIFQVFIIPYRRHWLLKPALLTFGDVTMGSAAVYVTGGIHSDFFIIYFLIAVLSAIRFGGGAAAIATLLSIVMYTSVVFLQGITNWLEAAAVILLRMGFVATTGVFVGYVGDKARQVELDLQSELDKAHEQLNESTALLNQNLAFQAVLQTAANEARNLLSADFSMVQMSRDGEDFILHQVEHDYLTPYISVNEAHKHVVTDKLSAIGSLFHDLLRLSPLLQETSTENSNITVVNCVVERELEDIFSFISGAPVQLISVPIVNGDRSIGVIYLLKRNKPLISLRDTERNILSVFSNRIATTLTNALVLAQSKLQAISDPVTGLYNHRHLHEQIRKGIEEARNNQTPMSLIVLDIDSFKLFNDTYGHSIGDMSLRSVADMIRLSLQDQGMAFRFGGDEFAIILKQLDNADACLIAEAIRKRAVELSHRATHEAMSSLSISLGVATFPESGETSEALFHAADLALYVAKAEGKNLVKSATHLLQNELSSDHENANKTALFAKNLGVSNVSGMELQVINALITAVDAKDQYTHKHSISVANLSTTLAERVGLKRPAVERVRLGALLHDVGKIGIPDVLLRKDDKLTHQEYETVKRHPAIGAQIISPIQSFEVYIPIVMHHHEWFNGAGYPLGLKEEEIPIEARIVSICDAYDAMTSNRPYRKAMPEKQALALIQGLLGTQFDPSIWDSFFNMILEQVPVGAK